MGLIKAGLGSVGGVLADQCICQLKFPLYFNPKFL